MTVNNWCNGIMLVSFGNIWHRKMRGNRSSKNTKGSIDRSETFDEFLAKEGLLAETEDAALKEIIADQIKVAEEKK